MEIIFSSSFFFFFFFFFLCCFIIQAHSQYLSINYTIRSTDLVWNTGQIYPVLVNKFTPLTNGNFSLAFRPVTRSKGKYELGIFMTIDNAEPQMIWSARQAGSAEQILVPEESRLELDSSSGTIILKDAGRNYAEVWSAGQNVSSWELKSEGSLLLYANETVVWNSMDYLTDAAVVGQNFTKLTAGTATAMFQNGSFIVNASSARSICQFQTRGGVKARLTIWDGGGVGYNMMLQCLNGSGLPTETLFYIFGNYSFIRLNKDGSFMLYGIQRGKWLLYHTCYSSRNTEFSESNCKGESETWVYILTTLVLLMFCLQLLWIFTKKFRRISRKLSFMSIICSISATSIVIWRLLLHHDQEYPYSILSKTTFAIDLIILQASTIFLIKWMAASPKIIATLILLHMLSISCSFLTFLPFLSSLMSLISIISGMLSFCIYPWLVVNTIWLLLTRLPGRRRCKRKTRICLVVFLNVFIVPCCLVGAYLYYYLYFTGYNKVKRKVFSIFIMISLNLLSFIFILVSAWAFYIHYTNSILATLKSFMKSTQVATKKILLWLLLGRRQSEPSDITMSLSSFNYTELEVVTNNFSKMVGKGGFGGVYEGTLLDGKKVAVKKLESNSQGLQEFKSEIETLGKIHHVHLVELLGFCAEGPHKLLVYDFMSNGSLEKWIFKDDSILDWRNRMKILLGTAQGLAYLHEECEPKILHLDVKPQNILLDDSFNAKVSDFGLCRLLPGDQTSILLTRMMGTFGYLPPEWVNGTVSEKHDVYSFGIVMLETLSGRKSSAIIALGEDYLHFLEWVMQSMENGTLIDSRLRMHEGYNEKQSRGLTKIALLCIHEDANMRPSMKRVVKLLEGIDDASTHLDGDGQANDQNTFYSMDEESVLL